MQRYSAQQCEGGGRDYWVEMMPDNDGEYVLHGEAQAEIDRLKAEVERLLAERYELAYAICGGEDAPGYLDAQSTDEIVKVARDNARWHMEAIGREHTAWNDAIEAAAFIVSKRADELCDSNSDSGVVEEVSGLTDSILALRKP